MLIPNAQRKEIYEYLFKEGVLVAKKANNTTGKHDILTSVRNLYIIKACQGLKSRGMVKETFCWRHYYWYLTNEGIQYLRDYLHLPAEIVPSTLKRQSRAEPARARPKEGMESGPRPSDDRSAYRRNAPGGGPPDAKNAEMGAGTADMQFRGGYGRGRPRDAPQ